jgi:hypothetical protein
MLELYDYKLHLLILVILDLVLGCGSPCDVSRFSSDLFRLSVWLRSQLVRIRQPHEHAIATGAVRMLFTVANIDSDDPDAIILEFYFLSAFHSISPKRSCCSYPSRDSGISFQVSIIMVFLSSSLGVS